MLKQLLWVGVVGLGVVCGCATTVSKDAALSEQAYQAIQGEDYDKAKSLLEEALQLNPKNAYAWLNLGVVHQKQEQYEKAKECYLKVVENAGDETGRNKAAQGHSLVRIAKENLEKIPAH